MWSVMGEEYGVCTMKKLGDVGVMGGGCRV